MTLDDARKADREGRLIEAATLYEEALSEGRLPVDALMDMAILYWQATDYGYWTGKELPLAFVRRAGIRFREILELAQAQFPGSAEPVFWQRYTRWADVGEPLAEAECIGMLQEDPTSLVPSMHIFATSEGRSHSQEAMRLLSDCKARETTRTKYISSVIEGVLKRHPDAR